MTVYIILVIFHQCEHVGVHSYFLFVFTPTPGQLGEFHKSRYGTYKEKGKIASSYPLKQGEHS